jgi:hypothetical protein
MLVFRENRVAVSTHLLVRTLAEKISVPSREELLDTLLRAGELECSLADAGSPTAARAASVTDALADALVTGACFDAAALAGSFARLDVPPTVRISPPEGFAYYALHPMSYAELVQRGPFSPRAAVIGIRSIGTTLGAVVAAALAQRGTMTGRVSVRPTGHPFDRLTRFSREQLAWVADQRDGGTMFFVVDEGPGLSGSSFLSVGDALVRAGVERSRICFLCSHEPNPESLRAYNGADRWSSFDVRAVQHKSHIPPYGAVELGGGKWRAVVYPGATHWPACWPQMERVKFLTPDRRFLLKFEGLGRFGAQVWDRSSVLAEAGFGPVPDQLRDGFGAYRWIQGRPGAASEVSEPLLDRLAAYCAFRSLEFRVPPAAAQPDLAEMTQCNLREEFGGELEVDDSVLRCEHPVLVDGRMRPHEWVRTPPGVWMKTDAAAHADDHFYPGPTDIAWDLAGAIVEWEMDRDAKAFFLARYRRLTGDDPGPRLPAFLRAYSAFRLGYSKMAAEGVGDEQERQRLLRDYERYRQFLCAQLPHFDARHRRCRSAIV